MASSGFSSRDSIRRDALISNGGAPRHCVVLIDADYWTRDSRPEDIGGILCLPRSEWEALASADRLILTLVDNGEPYRMILDGDNGRFVARRL